MRIIPLALSLFFFWNAFGNKELDSYLFDQTKSYSALIFKDSDVVYERYSEGFEPNQKQLFWSCTKAVIGTLIGFAIDEKRIRWEQSICEILAPEEIKDKNLCQVQIEHLMFWNSGIEWSETYEKAVLRSDVIEMLFGKGRLNMASFVLSHKLERKPGSQVEYSSGDTILLSYILKKLYPDSEYKQLLELKLKQPLGLTNFLIERDPSGTYVGSSFLVASPRDMAQFGGLYLNKGWVGSKKILSSEFITKVSNRNLKFPSGREKTTLHPIEGGQWFLNQNSEGSKSDERPWTHWPSDTYAAMGHWGQILLISPSKKIVFVRTGDDRVKQKFDANEVGKILSKAGLF